MKKKIAFMMLSLTFAGCAVGFSACELFGGGGGGQDDEQEEGNYDFAFVMADDGSGYVFDGYSGTDTVITVPSSYNGKPVVAMNNVFNGNSDITEVALPDCMIRIGKDAFANTESLTKVTFPANLQVIGENAFYGSAIRTAELGSAVTSIGKQAFYNAQYLTDFSVSAQAPVKLIDIHTFNGCTSLKNATLPDALKTVEQFAFSGCGKLESVSLKHVEKIESNAFEKCSNLSSVDFGDSLKIINSSAFIGSGIVKVELPETCTDIYSYSFSECSKLEEIIIKADANLMSGIFADSLGVKKITAPGFSIRSLFQIYGSSDLSSELTQFTELNVIGNEKIPADYAADCSKLQTITIAETVTEIGSGCFVNTAWYNAQPDGLVYNGKFLLGYKGAEPSGAVTVKDGTLSVADGAFAGCAELTQINLPSQLKNIGDSAFAESGITSLTVPENTAKIGEEAFKACASLTAVTFSQNLVSLGAAAFEDCNIAGELVLPSSLETLGNRCLRGNGITKLTLPLKEDKGVYMLFADSPESLKEITAQGSHLPVGAFANLNYVEKITLSDEITEIPENAFRGCSSLTEVEYGDITKIGANAFTNCRSIASLVIPDTVTEIGAGAFSSMGSLENVTLGKSLKKISENAFSNCGKLKNIALNDGLEYIGDKAFSYTALTQLIIPESVTYVGEWIVEGIKTDFLNFKLLAEAGEPNGEWHELWNLNIYDEMPDGEKVYNYFPTYYYSETEKTDGELLFWHYVDGVPVLW